VTYPFVKGHGTENDFIVLPDLNGSRHKDLDPALVMLLCDRRAGLGADGVLRVMRSSGEAAWFMDYRNADGSIAQMCGNGIRVFARYLAATGLVRTGSPLAVETRGGVVHVTYCGDGEISVDMGEPQVLGPAKVEVEGRSYDALSVTLPNPHAVALVDSLDEAGPLREAPTYPADEFPDGVNVEFVQRRGPNAVSMRVYERGVGETRSCGTGACAAVVAAVHASDERLPQSYSVTVPGGHLSVTWDDHHHIHLKGPAVLVAEGVWSAT